MASTEKQKEYDKRYREKNKKKLAERSKKWREDNREQWLDVHQKMRNRPEYIESQKEYVAERRITKPFIFAAQIIRHRAKLMGIECELTPEYLESIWTGICPIFGVEIFIGSKKGEISDLYQASVDRLDNSKGYTEGNVHFISFRANRLKRDASFAEFEKIYEWWKTLIEE